MTVAEQHIIRRVKWDIRFLRLAKEVSSWSKDPSTKVGAVITGPLEQIWGVGFNGFPMGVWDDPFELKDRTHKLFKMVHAENNALAFVERSVKGGTLYTYPFMPCSTCAGIAIQRGITRVVSLKDFPDRWVTSFEAAKDMFGQAGVELQFYIEGDLKYNENHG